MGGATVIIGGGHGGVQVAASLRQLGYSGQVILVSDETRLPYHRPPLSKNLKGGTAGTLLPLRGFTFYEQQNVELLLQTRIVDIDVPAGIATTQSGRKIQFDTLVLATGSRPWRPDISGMDLDGVHVLRTHEDAERLAAQLHTAASPVIIGAGMIGLEFAAVAATAGKTVTVIEATNRLLGRAASQATAGFLRARHEQHGVVFLTDETVERLEGAGRVERVVTRSGRTLDTDLVLLAVGAVANTELAERAGLTVAGGIVVDASLRTSAPNIFAIGDCASFPMHGGPLVRLESVQNATDQAKCVAQTITGDEQRYDAVPWFWSDQYEFKLQMVGVTGGADAVHTVGDPATGRFANYCFRNGLLVGVETVNQPREHMAARRLFATGYQLSPSDLSDPDFSLSGRDQLGQHSRGAMAAPAREPT